MRKISSTTLSKIIHFLLSLNPDNNFLPNFSLFFLIVKMRLKIANFLHLMRAREGNFHSLFCIISYLYLFMLPYSQSGLEGFHVVIAIHIFSQTRVHFLNESYIFFFFFVCFIIKEKSIKIAEHCNLSFRRCTRELG